MDEALRAAQRSGDHERLRALQARAGEDPFDQGPVNLGRIGGATLSLSPGGRYLASLDEDRDLELWDVARGELRHLERGFGAASLVVRLDPLQLLWAEPEGLFRWRLDHGDPERLLAAPPETQRAALSGDGRWVGFVVGSERVELHELGHEGEATGVCRRAPLEQRSMNEHDYEAHLTELWVQSEPGGGVRFAATGAETAEEHCCSSEVHDHWRLRYAPVLFTGHDTTSRRLADYGGFYSEELEPLLEELSAAPAVLDGGAVHWRGEVVEEADEELDDEPPEHAFRPLAAHPSEPWVLCNRDDMLQLRSNAEAEPRWEYVDAYPAQTATFSPDGRHLAWISVEGTFVAPLSWFGLD